MVGHASIDLERIGIPERERDATWDGWRTEYPEQKEWAKTVYEYCENLDANLREGIGLTMLGKVGTGKTRLAAMVSKAVAEAGRSTFFVKEKVLFDTLKRAWEDPQMENQLLNRYRNCRFLVIDDFGVRKATEYVSEMYQDIIDTRYDRKRSTCITSNVVEDELIRLYPRQMDRLAGNIKLLMVGRSMRGTA